MGYAHTQRGPMHWVLWGTCALAIVLAWSTRREPLAAVLIAVLAAATAYLAFCFRTLTVHDGGDALVIHFGPIALFRRRVPYASMRSVRTTRSALIDGWGIHWIPGRGWTWNLWGRACVEIETERGCLRVGTDDGDALAAFLRTRMAGDVERGDTMLLPFLRWLEGRFPELTEMMQAESPASRIYDVALAEDMATLFVHAARAEVGALPVLLRAAAKALGPKGP